MRLECSARSMKAQRRRAHKNIYPGSPAVYLRLDLVVSAAALIVALDSHQEESLSVTLVLILFAEAAITYCTGAVRVAPSLVFHHQSAPIFQHGDKVRIETIFVGLEPKGCILLTLQVPHPVEDFRLRIQRDGTIKLLAVVLELAWPLVIVGPPVVATGVKPVGGIILWVILEGIVVGRFKGSGWPKE